MPLELTKLYIQNFEKQQKIGISILERMKNFTGTMVYIYDNEVLYAHLYRKLCQFLPTASN
jgi:hypothetical protein